MFGDQYIPVNDQKKGKFMVKTFTTATLIAAASLSFVAFAQADEFSAAPMNSGPPTFMMSSPAPEPMMEKPMMHKKMMHKKKMMMKKDM